MAAPVMDASLGETSHATIVDTGSAEADEDMYAPRSPPLASAVTHATSSAVASKSTCCPQQHTLTSAAAALGLRCDVCRRAIKSGEAIYSCAPCDFDACDLANPNPNPNPNPNSNSNPNPNPHPHPHPHPTLTLTLTLTLSLTPTLTLTRSTA